MHYLFLPLTFLFNSEFRKSKKVRDYFYYDYSGFSGEYRLSATLAETLSPIFYILIGLMFV